MTGYYHPLYAASLAEFGEPRELPCSGAWLLERAIAGGPHRDAMGCYPIFSASNWSGLDKDLAALAPRLVSVALVADPFGEYLPRDLSSWFDKVAAFKEHYIVDFSKPLSISRHHRYYGRRAVAAVSIEAGPPPERFADEWSQLYRSLVRKRGLKGIKAFSKAAFERQLVVPGLVLFRAFEEGAMVGAHLWYVQRNVAYSHLAASTERGYAVMCPYAIYSAVIEYFRSRAQYIDLGAGAGLTTGQDGLSRFKAGWANGTRPAYFCGRILNAERYEELSREFRPQETDYFPAYRRGELE